MLNKNALFEVLFCDELIMDTVGILEYEPPRTEKSERIKHRDYLKRQVGSLVYRWCLNGPLYTRGYSVRLATYDAFTLHPLTPPFTPTLSLL